MNHLLPLPLHTDPLLLQALLTALVAPRSHLLVRTPDHDISLVARLVLWTLSSVFDYPTHRAKVRPPNGPPPTADHFLKSLFFTNPSAASAHTSQDESSDPTHSRRRHSRTAQHLPHVRQPDPLSTGRLLRNYILNTSPPHLSRALVVSGIEHATLESQRALARVMADHRISFTSDSRAEESFDLPDGFIMVYICPFDPRERPKIHHTLLDKFAMSCNVFIKPNVKQSIQSSIPQRRPISIGGSGHHSNTSSPLVNSHIPLPPSSRLSIHRNSYHSASASSVHRDPFPTLTAPLLPKNFISNLQKAYQQTYISPTLMTYLNDLFSATRHRAELDGTFLTARCMRDAEKVVRAHRVICTDLNGMELLRDGEDEDWLQEAQDEEEDEKDGEQDEEDEAEENSDEQWQTVETDELSAFGISFPKPLTLSSPSKPLIKIQEKKIITKKKIPRLEVTEINMARMFPRCVSHRLRVRDGSREEVIAGSMLFGATFDEEIEEIGGGEVYLSMYEERPTVKDVLVSILSEV